MPTALITGGHSGIGFECARVLASRSRYDLILAGRSPERMEEAARELRAASGTTVSTLRLDVSSLSSVRDAAVACRSLLDEEEEGPLQALLCNAGAQFHGSISYSPDGFEETFATNCLGHFLLVELLVDRMAEHGRVVFTASGTHDPDTMDGKMVGVAAEPEARALANQGKDGRKPLSTGRRYSTSKLCTMLYAYETHRRLRRSSTSIASIAFDPGSIPETGLLRTMPGPVRSLAKTKLMKWGMRRIGVTTSSLAFSGAALAEVAADPAYADGSGKYFQSKDGRLTEARSSKMSYDERRALKLWEDSKVLVGLVDDEESPRLR